ncbi:MAG: efflux RND transporter periplasmic adaptor subunit [Burkholderiales bacterium]|nr:efflux RND transporter periplasmic adaptor subunit [Burkholderiales bacterium]
MKAVFDKRIIWGLLATLPLIGVLLFSSKKAETADTAQAQTGNAALTVTVSVPLSSSWNTSLTASGGVAAWQEAIIGSELNGVRLQELLVQVGDQVKRGQLLATFSNEILSTEQAQQSAALAEAEAIFAEANSNARRAMQLKESGSLSDQQINQYATARNTAAARVSAAKASLQAATVKLQHARVLAPDDGIISARSATVGAVPQYGQELFRLIRQGKLEWHPELSADESMRLSAGQSVSVFNGDAEPIKGKLRMLAPTLDPHTRKALAYVDLEPAANSKLRPGMFVKGEFFMGESMALSVPSSAVLMRDGYASVFVLENANKVKQVRVSTGRIQQGRIEITKGLSSNAKVVDSGAGFLGDGDTVKLVSAQTSASQNSGKDKSGSIKAASGK